MKKQKIDIGDLLPKGEFLLHSKFKDIVNFNNEENQLISLASSSKFLAANTIVTENINCQQVEKIIISESGIYIDSVFFCSMIA